MALGIGATTAIFSLVDQIMLRSLPVVKPQDLWRIGRKIHCCGYGGYTQDEEFSIFSWDLYRHFRDNTPEFSDPPPCRAATPHWRCARLAAVSLRIQGNGVTAHLKMSDQHWLDIIGRVRPGTDPKKLEARLRLELHAWQATHLAEMSPQEKEMWQQQKLFLTPGGTGVDEVRETYRDGLTILRARAGCMLLLACANIANLLLARGLRNRQQTSSHIALGAPRRRLVRKALVESVTLAALSDPTRRRVLQLLRKRPMSAGELSDHFAVSKPTMSAHFSVLQNAGLMEAEKKAGQSSTGSRCPSSRRPCSASRKRWVGT